MAEPFIKDHDRLSLFLKYLPLILIITALVLLCGMGFKSLNKAGEKDFYDPSECGEGFVYKANELLCSLLAEIDDQTEAISLETLNKRYKALEFALPYNEVGRPYIEASDLRLVAIHPEYIKDEKLKRFYYNSRLPQLLQRQGEYLSETFFNIKTHSLPANQDKKRPIEITAIKLYPSMFKVALERHLWDGTIESSPNCLFEDSTSVYLSFGNTILPLHNDTTLSSGNNDIQFNAIMGEGIILSDKQEPVDYYTYYKKAWESAESHCIRINLREKRGGEILANIGISFSHDSIRISNNCGLQVIGNGKTEKHRAQVIIENDKPFNTHVDDGMKLLVYNTAFNRKYGEFTIHKHNPLQTLSSLVQSSMGTSRYYTSEYQTDLFTQQLLQGVARYLSKNDSNQTKHVTLTIDPLLSRELENDIKDYLAIVKSEIDKNKPQIQHHEQYDMSVTVMDMETGNILASPFYTSQFDHQDFPDALRMATKNTALTRRSIGSTFKPLVALASVIASPSLISLNTSKNNRYTGPANWSKSACVKFFGHQANAWAISENQRVHWNGCDFKTFIGRSDDVFPVGLVALAMSGRQANVSTKVLPVGEDNDFFDTNDNDLLRFKQSRTGKGADLATYPFTSWLSHLYGIRIQEQADDEENYITNDIHIFDNLIDNDAINDESKSIGLQEMSPDLTQLRMDRFLDGENFKSLLVPWVLGQGDNMWNCIKVAEAWCRMVGKYNVKATLIKPSGKSEFRSLLQSDSELPLTNIGKLSGDSINQVWNRFLDIFKDAQSFNGKGGTLFPMNNRVADLNKTTGDSLILFSKTGTPDAYTRYEVPLLGGNRRFLDVGMYTFALVRSDQYKAIKENKQGKGIVCVIRITRSYDCSKCSLDKKCAECEGYWGVKSSHARDFFSEGRTIRLQKLYDMTRRYY